MDHMKIMDHIKKLTHRYEWAIYITPGLLLLSLVYAYPVVRTLTMSTQRVGITNRFVGIENYVLMFRDDTFWLSLRHNLQMFLIAPILVFISLSVSFVLFEKPRGWGFYRFVIFLPTILPITAVGIVFSDVFKLHGSLNTLFDLLGLSFLRQDWLGSESWALITVIAVIIWRQMGFGVVLFLARFLSISEDLFDAARVEGAGWWQRLWYVAIPQARPVIDFFAILTLINLLAWVFNYVYILTYGGPGRATYVLDLYIYNKAFKQSLMGFAAAASEIIFIITAFLIFLQNRIRQRYNWEIE